MDPIDVYSDQFQINLGPWGATVNFQLSSYQPPAPGSMPQAERVATIRTSFPHLKTMVFMMKRQIDLFEEGAGVKADVPTQVLSSLGIGREDWDAFWRPRST